MRVDVAELPAVRVMVDGFREIVGPDGETVALSETLPESPLMLAMVIVEFPVTPGGAVRVAGLAETVKSTTWTVTCTE